MKLIVGLGNPDRCYEKTYHNLGFMAVEKLAEKLDSHFTKRMCDGLVAESYVNGQKIILLKPLTFMNLSGNSIKAYADYFNIEHKDIVIIYDDKDLPFANLRLREKGNPGSHNGMKNITQMLQKVFTFCNICFII